MDAVDWLAGRVGSNCASENEVHMSQLEVGSQRPPKCMVVTSDRLGLCRLTLCE